MLENLWNLLFLIFKEKYTAFNHKLLIDFTSENDSAALYW